ACHRRSIFLVISHPLPADRHITSSSAHLKITCYIAGEQMSFSHATGHDFPTEMPRPANLAALRQRIRHIERPVSHGVLPFGVAAIDRALPGGGLARGAVHEILGIGGDEEDGARCSNPSPPFRGEREGPVASATGG